MGSQKAGIGVGRSCQELPLPVMRLEEGRGRKGKLNQLSSMVLETKGLPVNS